MAWVLNMIITGAFAFMVFAWPAAKLLPDAYYEISNPSSLKSIFKLLGGERFRKFLLLTFWKNKSRQKEYFTGKKSGLLGLDFQSRQSEFGHLLPFVILLITSGLLIWENLYVLAFLTLVFNIAGNFYPILLQRHHRMRISSILQRQKG